MSIRRHSALILFAILGVLLLGQRAYADSPKVTVSVSSETAQTGDSLSMSVKAEGFPSIRAAQVKMIFDPKVLQVGSSIRKGNVFAKGVVIPKIDNAKGEIIFGATFLGTTTPFTGSSGELFTVDLSVVGKGQAALRFSNEGDLDGLMIIDASGKEYKAADMSVIEAQVLVEGAGGQEPGNKQGRDPLVVDGPTLEEDILNQLEQQIDNLPDGQKGKVNLFTDVSDHWAKSYINLLASRKIINGYADGSFRPDLTVTRAEFAKMIVAALGLETEKYNEISFSDNKEIPNWAQKYVAIAVEKNIISGYDNNQGQRIFAADKAVTRQEMTVMFARALRYAGIRKAGIELEFRDNTKIQSWAREDIDMLSSMGILSGYPDGEFKPDNLAKRGEAAKMIIQLLKVLS